MTNEHIQASFGIVPVYLQENTPLYLLVLNKNGGHWGFPKGRAESDEAPLTAAIRELGEEAGVDSCTIADPAPLRESYVFEKEGMVINKTVMYFIGLVNDTALTLQPKEIDDARWVTKEEGMGLLTFDTSKNILEEASKKVMVLNNK
jgi:8-oxo-dGTP pyrophosphatase MutT (NUDIX family)